VVDLGCGGGSDIQFFESLGCTDIHGCDSSVVMIKAAKKVVQAPENLVVADIQTLPFDAGAFDVATSRFAFHYLHNPHQGFMEARRVLKDNGLFLCAIPHPLWDMHIKQRKKYDQQEILHVPLFRGQVTVHYPSHTLRDYFSPEFFTAFRLLEVYEYGEGELEGEEMEIPSVLVFAARAV
jgi:ubiquinone/menaquinone biosynthesis C-methylase UbiE